MHIIDRRLNPKGKSLPNRQRFLRRAKALVRQAVHESSSRRGVKDVEQGGEMSIPRDGVREPSFHHGQGKGVRNHILPGNKEFVEGDTIPRPPSGGGRGNQGSPDGDGEDDFRFALSRDEFVDLFLEDLELPDLVKQKVAQSDSLAWHRAGYSPTGSPANLSLSRTMRNSLSRRIALKRPNKAEIRALYEEIEDLERKGDHSPRLEEARRELEELLNRTRRIPYVDPLDVRYRRFDSTPKPVTQAVMFCLMDVSGSMGEEMKDLAKRFFMLLHIFLTRRYRHVDVVFIRHTHRAEEVDEDTFFHSPETGGTVVSTALDEMMRVVRERYPVNDWNIYAAHASDGDNTSSDAQKVMSLMENAVLPACQYFAYIEVGRGEMALPVGPIRRDTDLWNTYRALTGPGVAMAMRKVQHRRDIFPVFRDLFKKDPEAAARSTR